eukprot:scaffold22614_cov53-Attheya_sp.AAC.2
MPIKVTLRVKRSLVHERYPIAKKQCTNDLCSIRIKRETVNTEEVTKCEQTITTEEIDDGITACASRSKGRSAVGEPSDDLHLSHTARTITSKQNKSQLLGNTDHAELCSFNCSKETGLDSLSNEDHPMGGYIKILPRPPMNNVISELECEDKLECKEVSQSSTTREQADTTGVLNNVKKTRSRQSWDDTFQELVDFKKVHGNVDVLQGFGRLGRWVNSQRKQYRLWKEGKVSTLNFDRHDKLLSIGFKFSCQLSWDQRFQELVDFKNVNGHTNVIVASGPLGSWIARQRREVRLFKEGNAALMTRDRLDKLESVGFKFSCQTPWDQRFQELVEFKKVNGHTNVSSHSGALGMWAAHQRTHRRLWKEGKATTLTSDRRNRLESIGFIFSSQTPWDQRFRELVHFKKVNGHVNVGAHSGPLGMWGAHQRTLHRLWKEGNASSLTSDRCNKLESIGFAFSCKPPEVERFQELVDFKKVNGRANVGVRSGPFDSWVNYLKSVNGDH